MQARTIPQRRFVRGAFIVALASMRRQRMKTFALCALTMFAASVVTPQEHLDGPCSPQFWLGEESKWEAFLNTARVVSVETTHKGVTNPRKVALEDDQIAHLAVFKPIRRGRQGGFWESYQAEVAAYELDKLLGLDMVPPTVVRKIDGKTGSLQLGIPNCRTYIEVQGRTPHDPSWSHQLSRMKLFDELISNPDRHGKNFLVGTDWDIVLIDHSRAFRSTKKLDKEKLPIQFDRRLVEKLRTLVADELKERFGEWMFGNQIDGLLARRDRLLDYLDELISQKGEAQVLFP